MPDDGTIEHYLAGACTPDEQVAIDAWKVHTPEPAFALDALHARLMQPWPSANADRLASAKSAVINEIHAQARLSRPEGSSTLPISRSRIFWRSTDVRRTWLMACMVFGVILGGGLIVHKLNTRITSRVPSVTRYATTNGQRANITLPDGSTVVLNVASRLEVPVDYARGNRTLRLTGAALFTVRHHDGTPFIVVAGATQTRVLGTTFMVRHYPTDSVTTVAVHDGKVAVYREVLLAHQRIEVDRFGRLTHRAASTGEFAFAAGVLTVDNVPLQDAIADLNRWYDVEIRVADPHLLRNRLQASLEAGSRTDLATLLELALSVRVVRDGRVLTLYPK